MRPKKNLTKKIAYQLCDSSIIDHLRDICSNVKLILYLNLILFTPYSHHEFEYRNEKNN